MNERRTLQTIGILAAATVASIAIMLPLAIRAPNRPAEELAPAFPSGWTDVLDVYAQETNCFLAQPEGRPGGAHGEDGIVVSTYVVARSASRRATLQHRVESPGDIITSCGRSMVGWSRSFMARCIPEIYCLLCKRTELVPAPSLPAHPAVPLRLVSTGE
jgi:hypothetical protein